MIKKCPKCGSKFNNDDPKIKCCDPCRKKVRDYQKDYQKIYSSPYIKSDKKKKEDYISKVTKKYFKLHKVNL